MENDMIRADNQKKRISASRVVVVMRHGERRDGAVGAPSEVDPPLTEHGLAQVEEAAERLSVMLGPKRVKKMLVLVSPFLRTLQTARELQRLGIGCANLLVIDNTLCEVYGPARIKSETPPLLAEEVVRAGCGELPLWGESIGMASRRFVESFHRNCLVYPGRNLLFVTHGDAVGAILNAFYPMCTVYNVEYLSFIALRRSNSNYCGGKTDGYELIGSNGVQWLLDGPESGPKEVSVVNVNTISDPGNGANSIISFPQGYGINGRRFSYADSGSYMVNDDTAATVAPCGANNDNPDFVGVLLVVLAMVSQFFVFFTWSNRVDAAIYVTSVVVVEIFLLIRNACISRFPFLVYPLPSVNRCSKAYESQNLLLEYTSRHPFVTNSLLKLAATAVNVLFIFLLSIAFAFPMNILFGQSFTIIHSYKTFFTTITNAVVYLFFWIFNILYFLRENMRL